MAREYGEGFTRPRDFYTGEPIPGAPRIGYPTTTRPGGSGIIVLTENLGPGEQDSEGRRELDRSL